MGRKLQNLEKERLDANPLSVADLERERGYLDNVGYSLSFG